MIGGQGEKYNNIRIGWYRNPDGKVVRVFDGSGMTVHCIDAEGNYSFGREFAGGWEYLGNGRVALDSKIDEV